MRWTEIEIETLTRLAESGSTYEEIGDILNKTKKAVKEKLNRLNVKCVAYITNVETECKNCNEVFTSKKSENRTFCSKSCASSFNNRLRRAGNERFCEHCDLKLQKRQKRFCNAYCSGQEIKQKLINNWLNGDYKSVNVKEGLSRTIRKFLIEKNNHKCEECGWDKINPSTGVCPLEIDHINGDSTDNSPENLKVLCPNCHSLTPTYKALNKGKSTRKR